jgi:hypothetical protein
VTTLIVACVLGAYSVCFHEANRIKRANRNTSVLIFERCQNIPELRQFIELYKPEDALEFFDDGKVESVVCVTPVDDRYNATFNAVVVINDSGSYDLTGKLMFSITDSKGSFRTGISSSPGIRMNAKEWTRFVANGADIDSL